MCLFCFSKDRLSNDELKGKYGGAYAQYANNNVSYDITMTQGKRVIFVIFYDVVLQV